MCGYACINCGKCKGEVKNPLGPGPCTFCGAQNDPASARCSACGKRLLPMPGQSMKSKGVDCELR